MSTTIASSQPAGAPIAQGSVKSAAKAFTVEDPRAKARAEAEAAARANEEYLAQQRAAQQAAQFAAEEEARRLHREYAERKAKEDAEAERVDLASRLSRFGGSLRAKPKEVVVEQPTPSKSNPFAGVKAAVSVSKAVAAPVPVAAPVAQPTSNLLPATYVSQPAAISTVSFLAPKHAPVPKAPVQAYQPAPVQAPAPVVVAAPAPAPVPAPAQTSSGLLPATYVSQPAQLSAASFLAPKHAPVPKNPVPAAHTAPHVISQVVTPAHTAGYLPATHVSQPEPLSAASFLAPKNAPVPKNPVPHAHVASNSVPAPTALGLVPPTHVSQPEPLSAASFLAPKHAPVPKRPVSVLMTGTSIDESSQVSPARRGSFSKTVAAAPVNEAQSVGLVRSRTLNSGSRPVSMVEDSALVSFPIKF